MHDCAEPDCENQESMTGPVILEINPINNSALILKWIRPIGIMSIPMYRVRYKCGYQDRDSDFVNFSHIDVNGTNTDDSDQEGVSVVQLLTEFDDNYSGIRLCVFQVQGIDRSPLNISVTENSACGVINLDAHTYNTEMCTNITECPNTPIAPNFLPEFCNRRNPDQVQLILPYGRIVANNVTYLYPMNSGAGRFVCFNTTSSCNIQYLIERCNYHLRSICHVCGGNQILFRRKFMPETSCYCNSSTRLNTVTMIATMPNLQYQTGMHACLFNFVSLL